MTGTNGKMSDKVQERIWEHEREQRRADIAGAFYVGVSAGLALSLFLGLLIF